MHEYVFQAENDSIVPLNRVYNNNNNNKNV